METKDLIEQLSRQASPVSRLAPPFRRFMFWLAMSAFYAVVLLILVGMRPDARTLIIDPLFVWQTTLAIAFGGLSGFLAFDASVPGRDDSSWKRWVVGLIACAIAVTLIALACVTPHCAAGTGAMCSFRVALFGIVPAIALVVMLRRAAPLDRAFAGMMIGGAAFGVGSAAMQFGCANGDPLHLLIWHNAPGLIMIALGVWAAFRLLRI